VEVKTPIVAGGPGGRLRSARTAKRIAVEEDADVLRLIDLEKGKTIARVDRGDRAGGDDDGCWSTTAC